MTYDDVMDIIKRHPEEFAGLVYIDDFKHWLKTNMHIYHGFEKLAIVLRTHGKREYYSGWAIVNKMRWETLFQEAEPTEFKINNNCIAYLTRVVMLANPALTGMFRTNKPRGGDNG